MTAGGAALAGSYTSGGTTTTWVPLTDINGSTIGLVNSGSPTSPPGATYTYDPSGNVSVNGSNVTSWPFQYQGMEHEITDPANLYFNSSSNVYNPQIQNMLSQVGAQSLGGPNQNPAGPPEAGPSGQSGGLTWQKYQNDLKQGYEADLDASNFSFDYSDGGEAPIPINLGPLVGSIDFLINLLEDIFSSPSSPPIPRKLMHKRHPLYGQLLGIVVDNIPTEGSDGVTFCADPQPCNKPPLQKAPNPGAQPEYHKAPSPATQKPLGFWTCEGIFVSQTMPSFVGCIAMGYTCASGNLPTCPLAFAFCTYQIAGAKGCYDQAQGKPFPDLPESPPGDVPQRGNFGLP
jgi:hypothetical protein